MVSSACAAVVQAVDARGNQDTQDHILRRLGTGKSKNRGPRGKPKGTRERSRIAKSELEHRHQDVYERRWVLLKIPRCDIDGLGEEQ